MTKPEPKRMVGKFEIEPKDERIFTRGKGQTIPSLELAFLNVGEMFFVPETEMIPSAVSSIISYFNGKGNKKELLGRHFSIRRKPKKLPNGEEINGTWVFRVK